MFNLLRYFSITSALAIICTSAVVWFGYQNFSVKEAVKLSEAHNVELARSFANTLWPKYSSFIMATPGTSGDELRNKPEIRQIDERLKAITSELSVLKVKIYTVDGLTVYSSEPSQIGENKRGSPGFMEAARDGEVASELSHRDRFSAFSREVLNREVVETYIPIRNAQGGIEGIFEIYSDVTALMDTTRTRTTIVLAGYLLAFTLLYCVLVLTVRRADIILKRQDREIKDQAREAEQQLHRQLLSEQARMRDVLNLAGGIAHEVGNPLASLSGELDRLEATWADREPFEGENFLGVTGVKRSAIERISGLLHRLMAFPEIKDDDWAPEAINVNEMVKGVCELVRINDSARHLSFDVNLSKDIPAAVAVRSKVLLALFVAMTAFAESAEGTQQTFSVTTTPTADGIKVALCLSGDKEPGEPQARDARQLTAAAVIADLLDSSGGSMEYDTMDPSGVFIYLPVSPTSKAA